MSIEAIAFVKALDVDNATSRLLLFVIGENTFNDTGLCRVGQTVLCSETKASERTIRRHLVDLQDEGVLKTHPQVRDGGGRAPDAIELVGFLEWLDATRCSKPVKMAGVEKTEANRSKWPDQTGQQVAASNRPLLAGSYKDTRTSNRTSSAQAREEFKSDLKKSGPALASITITPADCSWTAWIDFLRAGDHAALADDAVAAGRMNVTKRWPKGDTPLPVIDKRPRAAKALAERVVGEGAA